ncbi:ribulokinase [Robertkochia solimangrovi]|uniref:ribulokinase n=1 Tax=Robertkochia solimangrovi TaxID=2213046 RepID=UPI00117CF269|nr:ribulokinase [Robertkochia solimangrovi]TRZ45906.1 ribulokinase [Robertkochia solimangrovi]
MKTYVIGLDYGTDSVRAVLVNSADGAEVASSVHYYQRWKEKQYCKPIINQFRQHPLDHLEGLENTIKGVMQESGVPAASVKAICIDTTGSSPMALTAEGQPLVFEEGFEENPNAMMVLWKDHTAVKEAAEINELCKSWGGPDYSKYEGGIYSSEWFWAKILHIIREDAGVKEAAHTWMEHCDYLTYVLADNKDLESFRRSRCAAGHKAMWHSEWGGLPSKEFLSKLDPELAALRDRLYTETYTSDEAAGNLNEEWAEKLGLTTDTVIAVGTFDAHAGAVGAKVQEHNLVRVMGTSTCDIIVADNEDVGANTVNGICGQVDGSVIPGLVGLEAGQSAFGDLLAWFKDVLSWPLETLVYTSDILTEEQRSALKEQVDNTFIAKLSEEAASLSADQSIPIALDWINGRRTPDANQELKAAISGLSLGTRAPHIFNALVNAICFGSKMIVDRFEAEGVRIDSVTGIGGVARKSPFIMQTLADVLNKPIMVAASDQAPALGAAIYAAVVGGVYPNVNEASKHLGSDFEAEYQPQSDKLAYYEELMAGYTELAGFIETTITKNK